ncbi:hypothetical protein [Gemmatirosa kalamazoonensis]|uniref:hypothetical protein n=1 Tax=Gemmatirosa kalamazoonensis TaxID=861299 RepID=UPI00046C8CA3|nr:hypothetical protein [Gemmatirosa kalamazoonensis]
MFVEDESAVGARWRRHARAHRTDRHEGIGRRVDAAARDDQGVNAGVRAAGASRITIAAAR